MDCEEIGLNWDNGMVGINGNLRLLPLSPRRGVGVRPTVSEPGFRRIFLIGRKLSELGLVGCLGFLGI